MSSVYSNANSYVKIIKLLNSHFKTLNINGKYCIDWKEWSFFSPLWLALSISFWIKFKIISFKLSANKPGEGGIKILALGPGEMGSDTSCWPSTCLEISLHQFPPLLGDPLKALPSRHSVRIQWYKRCKALRIQAWQICDAQGLLATLLFSLISWVCYAYEYSSLQEFWYNLILPDTLDLGEKGTFPFIRRKKITH